MDVVVGVDTVVESAGLILEKPNDADHALRMLQSLSGGRHQVHTGVVFKFMNGSSHSFHETTYIDFAIVPTEVSQVAYTHAPQQHHLRVQALQAYVQSGEVSLLQQRCTCFVIMNDWLWIVVVITHIHQPMDKAGGFGIQGRDSNN